MGLFALLLRELAWWQAAVMPTIALVLGVYLLPRLGGRALYRPADVARGYPTGILLYPLAVLLLILAFPRRPDIVAAAWGIMAFGDGAATLAGQWIETPRLPWNRDKTVAGTLAFCVAGSVAGVILEWWTRSAMHPQPPILFVLAAPVVAAVFAAAIETIPVRLNDNITVPVAAAVVLWGLSLMTRTAWIAASTAVVGSLTAAACVNTVAAFIGWRLRTVSAPGGIAGAVIGTLIYATTGAAGWLLLFAAFAAASISSRLGLERKTLLGIAEKNDGRRGASNALANCGVAVFASLLAVLTPYRDAALLALVASLAAGGSDTVASEIGKAWGRHTFLITRLTRVQPGTPGAVSFEGTAAGLVAAFSLASVGLGVGLIAPRLLWVAAIAATIGSLVESALGASLEARGILNNDLLNFTNTAVAAVCALAIAHQLA